MARPLRIEYPGAFYHITSRGNERKKIFNDDYDRIKFLEILQKQSVKFGTWVHGYVLMPNHYHLIIETPNANLSAKMHGLNCSYSIYYNRRHSRIGHFLQGRYLSIIVDRDSYLMTVSRYLHLNPVRAKLVADPLRYHWSSYSGFIDSRFAVPWVQYENTLTLFSDDLEQARRRYRQYVESYLTEELENPLEGAYRRTVLGGEDFMAKIEKIISESQHDQQLNEFHGLISGIRGIQDPSTLLKSVAEVFQIAVDRLFTRGRDNHQARKIAIYILKQYTTLSNREIGAYLGGLHYSTVSKAAALMDKELAENQILMNLLSAVKSHAKI
ncbi:MAG: transposase [Bacillota bacterium]